MNPIGMDEYRHIIRKRISRKHKKLCYVQLDKDYNVIYISEAFEDFGFDLSRLRDGGASVSTALSPEDYKRLKALFENCETRGSVRRFMSCELSVMGEKTSVILLIYRSNATLIDSQIFDLYIMDKKRGDFIDELALSCEMEQELIFKRSMDCLEAPVCITSGHDIEYANPAFANAFGYKLRILHSMSIEAIATGESREKLLLIQSALYNGRTVSAENIEFFGQDGRTSAAKLTGSRLMSVGSSSALNVFKASDFDKKNRGEDILDGLSIPVLLVDIPAGTIRYNREYAKVIGMGERSGELPLEEMLATQEYTFQSFMAEFKPKFEGCDELNDFHAFRRFNGSQFTAFVSARIIGNRVYLISCRDMSAQLTAERELENLKTHDSLTGLGSSETFYENLRKDFDSAVRDDFTLAFIVLDLNTYDDILREIGPSAANDMVKTLALRLKSFINRDSAIGMLGHKRFGVSVSGKDYNGVIEYTEELMNVLDWPLVHNGHDIFMTARAGVARYPDDALTFREFYNSAFSALNYSSSRKVSNYSIFNRDDGMLSFEHKNSLEIDFSLAMENNEFIVYYQPKAAVQTNEVVGAEALIRWESPVFGIVEPRSFLHLAQSTGLIIPLGYKVIDMVCKQLSEWLHDGCAPIKMAINIDMDQLCDDKFFEMLTEIAMKYDISLEMLEFEIAEAYASLELRKKVFDTIISLRERGVCIALDNFGLGKLAVNELYSIPISRLTIDRSITDGSENDKYRRRKIESTIELARSLEVSCIAEGVENEEQLEILKTLGCDYYQGYLLSRPVSREAFTAFLTFPEKK